MSERLKLVKASSPWIWLYPSVTDQNFSINFNPEAAQFYTCALEDGNRRLQYRVGNMTDTYSNRLKIFTRWGQISSRGEFDAVSLLERFLEYQPETSLVIIDTL
jgi:hypothetical protein